MKPEVNLEFSIKALGAYDVGPNIIKDMLDSLQKITEKCDENNKLKFFVDFGIWLVKNDIQLENGNITLNAKKYIKETKTK